jgi:hypothetical protein
MSTFAQRYQQWLAQLSQALLQARTEQVAPLVEFVDKVQAYVKAGSDLTAYESQLFIETFRRQLQEDEQPSIWPEALWLELSRVTDKTQVEWQELLQDLEHQGIYAQGEMVGMGVYCCRSCQQCLPYYHPAELQSCLQCGGLHFNRKGLPV